MKYENEFLPKTLYITRNGLLEPLGQSQVLPYLRELSKNYEIFLVTFEKPCDLKKMDSVECIRRNCLEHNIKWKPQTFHSRPKYLASFFGFLQIVWLIIYAILVDRIKLIHARSYIPAAAARYTGLITRVPFIFDMRALWPEELITAGRLKRGGLLHKVIVHIERVCLRDASCVISLTTAGASYLQKVYSRELAKQNLVIIPTCADLNRFSVQDDRLVSFRSKEMRIHGCIGTVLSGWFLTNWLAAWYRAVANSERSSRFEVITRDDPKRVRSLVDPEGWLGERLSIRACGPEEMPDAVRCHNTSAMFYAGGEISELGRSPTRMAEVLGVGRPVVVNAGVGDIAEIVTKYRVGVVLKNNTATEITQAIDELEILLGDPDLPARCRHTAEMLFSLPSGAETYRQVYQRILMSPETKGGL